MSALVYLGSLLTLVGVIWLVILAVQTGKTTGEKVLWAVVNLFCNPIGGIVFFLVKKVGLVPLLLVIAGLILQGIGFPSMFAEMQRNMQNIR